MPCDTSAPSAATANPTRVGFVGTGHLGTPMAEHVARSFPLVAYDTDPAQGRDLGGRRAESLVEVAREADVICLSLPTGPISEQVVVSLLAAPDARTSMIIELSTIGPTAAERCDELARAAGWRYLDAPVSGGRASALAGTLAVMVAGDDGDIRVAEPILACFSGPQFVIGERPGLGQVMKLTNNAIALAVLPITSEALAFGGAHGLELSAMLDVINASSGRTQRSEGMFRQSILTGSFDHGARGEITEKDVSLYVEEAQRIASPTSIGTAVRDLYRAFTAAHPDTDYSYLHNFVIGLGSEP